MADAISILGADRMHLGGCVEAERASPSRSDGARERGLRFNFRGSICGSSDYRKLSRIYTKRGSDTLRLCSKKRNLEATIRMRSDFNS